MRLGIAKLANLGAESTPRANLGSERWPLNNEKGDSNLLNRM